MEVGRAVQGECEWQRPSAELCMFRLRAVWAMQPVGKARKCLCDIREPWSTDVVRGRAMEDPVLLSVRSTTQRAKAIGVSSPQSLAPEEKPPHTWRKHCGLRGVETAKHTLRDAYSRGSCHKKACAVGHGCLQDQGPGLCRAWDICFLVQSFPSIRRRAPANAVPGPRMWPPE